MRKTFLALLLSLGPLPLLSAAGCSASPGGDETSGSLASAAIYCRQGQDCFPSTYTCDPKSGCCVAGGPGWETDPKSPQYNFENALRSWHCTPPKAVALDGFGHWWFGSVCPYDSSDSAVIDAIVKANSGMPLEASEGPNHCTAPLVGDDVNVTWDPMCPSGCLKVADY